MASRSHQQVGAIRLGQAAPLMKVAIVLDNIDLHAPGILLLARGIHGLVGLDNPRLSDITVMFLTTAPAADHDTPLTQRGVVAGIVARGPLELAPDVADAGVGLLDRGEEFGRQLRELVLVDAVEKHHVRLRRVQNVPVRRVWVHHVQIRALGVHDVRDAGCDALAAEVPILVDVMFFVALIVCSILGGHGVSVLVFYDPLEASSVCVCMCQIPPYL